MNMNLRYIHFNCVLLIPSVDIPFLIQLSITQNKYNKIYSVKVTLKLLDHFSFILGENKKSVLEDWRTTHYGSLMSVSEGQYLIK